MVAMAVAEEMGVVEEAAAVPVEMDAVAVLAAAMAATAVMAVMAVMGGGDKGDRPCDWTTWWPN
jgi:hypothetical protein